jgi:hypothetical protein
VIPLVEGLSRKLVDLCDALMLPARYPLPCAAAAPSKGAAAVSLTPG